MVKLSFYCLRPLGLTYALRKGLSRASLRPKHQFLESLALFLAKVNYPRAEADACRIANVLGCTNWGVENSFWACVWRWHKSNTNLSLAVVDLRRKVIIPSGHPGQWHPLDTSNMRTYDKCHISVDGGNMVYFRRKSASHVEIIR